MNQLPAQHVAIEPLRVRQVPYGHANVRRPLDPQRMPRTPVLIRPGRLQTRIDGVFSDGGKLQLAVRLLRMSPDGKHLVRWFHLTTDDVEQAQAVFVELDRNFLDVVDVPRD